MRGQGQLAWTKGSRVRCAELGPGARDSGRGSLQGQRHPPLEQPPPYPVEGLLPQCKGRPPAPRGKVLLEAHDYVLRVLCFAETVLY